MRGDNVADHCPLIMSEPKKMIANGLKTHQRLVFEDASHQGKMLTHLNTMRKEGHFCDATLEVGSHNFPIHRAVLASCSIYMFELFSNKEDPSAKQHFKLKDGLDHGSFEVLINYAYTGRLECDADLVKSVYKTASLLKMHKVADQCSQFLTENLTPQSCLGIRAFASAYSDLDLTTKTNQYIEENLTTLPEKSPEFMRLPSIVIDIVGIDSSGLNSSSEKQLCQMIVDWIEMALDERPLQRLTENHQILYLDKDNSLRDCLDDLGDAGLNNSDIVRDYKKLGKRKQLQPVKGKRENNSNSRCVSKSLSLSSIGSGAVCELQTDGNVSPMMVERFSLVASKLVGENSYMCVAVLDNILASISIKLRLRSELNGSGSEDSTSPVHEKCQQSPFENQCSLTPLAPMSSARCGLGTALLNNRLIALGGYDRGDCLNSVEAFELDSNVWSPMKPMHTARGRFAVAQVGDRLYACGGCNGHAELSSAECYDPATEQWMTLPQMTIKRSSAGVTACDGKVYVIGGWSGCSGHAACEMFDPDVGNWQSIASLNLGRSQTGVCTVDGKIIAVGGCDAWNCTNTVEIYDQVNDKWTYLPPMSLARRGAGVAYFKGKLYVVGGSDGQASLASVEIYDMETHTWSFGPSLNTPRANVGLVVMDGRLFAVGGFTGKAFLESIEYLSEDAGDWSIFLPSGFKNCLDLNNLNGHSEEKFAAVDIKRNSISSIADIPSGLVAALEKGENGNGWDTSIVVLSEDECKFSKPFLLSSDIDICYKAVEGEFSIDNNCSNAANNINQNGGHLDNGGCCGNGLGVNGHNLSSDEIASSEFV